MGQPSYGDPKTNQKTADLEDIIRMLMKINIPVEQGNAAIKDGSLGPKFQSILEDIKPEAAYFFADNGVRTGLLIVNIDDSSQIPALAEPWFLAFNASIEATPCMNADDLQRAGPAIEAAVKKHG